MKEREQIGKVDLDYTHYPGKDFYCDGEVEQELLEIAKTCSAMEFPQIIEERKEWPVLYHLSPLRENIVDWLPMDKGMKVLEVGSGCGAITGKLAEKAGQVTCIELSRQRSLINAHRHMDCDNVTIHVGNFQDIEPELPCDYDYVCLIGVFEYGQSYIGGKTPFHDFFRILNRHVKPEGRLVIAIENKFGMKYWAGCREDHLGTFFSNLEDYPEGGGVRTFSRRALENLFKDCSKEEYSFYYPYPDYKFMTTLFSDRRLPQPGELTDNLRNFDRDRMLLFDEKNVFDAVLQEEMFPFYSNSYLAVVGKRPHMDYCRYSNDRSPQTAIKTEILTLEGKRVVYKSALTPYGADHIRRIQDSYEKLSKRYQGGPLAINHCVLEEGELPRVRLEYVEGVTLCELFDEKLKEGDEEGFFALFQEYVDRISYGEDVPIANYDMIFSNILVQGEKWTLIDYEWTLDRQVDTKEIAFRSLYVYLLENEKRNRLDMTRALEYIGIPNQEMEEYRERETAFQDRVTGKRMSMSRLREQIGQRVFEPLRWIEQISRQENWARIQIYEDRGAGYREEDSYFVREARLEGQQAEFTLKVAGNVSHLRIDPAREPCLCRILRFTFNGEPVKLPDKRLCTVNGTWVEGSLVFSTADPNINLHLERFKTAAENELELRLEIVPVPVELCESLEKSLKRRIRL